MHPVGSDPVVNYSHFSGSLIFYSWFIIGVFGISWSEYGLAGVEVAMLESPFWGVPSLKAHLTHANASWSGAGGWLKAVLYYRVHNLWLLLAFLSMLPFAALPISGLNFEITDGYIYSPTAPTVIGRNQDTFDERGREYFNTTAKFAWETGFPPMVPGFGIAYTPEAVDRTLHLGLAQTPNTLPVTESIPELFLAPQARTPVSGKAWGLRVRYNCSMVREASEFTVLTEKRSSVWDWRTDGCEGSDYKSCVNLATPSQSGIPIWKNSLNSLEWRGRGRLSAYFEIF